MAVTEKITCDICDIQKGEANHWMMADKEVNAKTGAIGVVFWPWAADYKDHEHHICGEACAGKMLAQSIASWSAPSQIENIAAMCEYPLMIREMRAACDGIGLCSLDQLEEVNHE